MSHYSYPYEMTKSLKSQAAKSARELEQAYPVLKRICHLFNVDIVTLNGLLKILDVPDEFVDFPKLLEFLEPIGKMAVQAKVSPHHLWCDWYETILHLRHGLKHSDERFSETMANHDRNILSTYKAYGKHPIVSAVMQPARINHDTANLFKAILISTAHFHLSRTLKFKMTSFAASLRITVNAKKKKEQELLECFLSLSEDTTEDLALYRLQHIAVALEPKVKNAQIVNMLCRMVEACNLLTMMRGGEISLRRKIFPPLSSDGKVFAKEPIVSLDVLVDQSEKEDWEPDLDAASVEEQVTKENERLSNTGLVAESKRSRFWIDQLYDAVYWARNSLHPYEIKAVEKRILSTKRSDQLSCFIVSLAYLTGLDADRIPELNIGTDLTMDGLYRKAVKLGDGAFEASDRQVEWLSPHSEILELQLPPFIKNLLSKLLPGAKKKSGTLGSLLSLSTEDSVSRCEQWLAALQEQGFHRLNMYRLRQTIRQRLSVRRKDLAKVHCVLNVEDSDAPIESFYASYTSEKLNEEYAITVRELLPTVCATFSPKTQNDAPRIGSQLYPDLKSYQHAIRQFSDKVFNQLRSNTGDLIEFHNLYVKYVAALLLDVTGHRPVDDPFAEISLIDELSGFAIIEDKAVNENRRSRLVTLIDVARKQIAAYKNHSKCIAQWLIDNEHPDLGRAIYQLVTSSNRSPLMPFLFTLHRNNSCIEVSGLPIREVKALISAVHPLPINLGRHSMSSSTREMGTHVPTLAANMGHFHGLAHTFGMESSLTPSIQFNKLQNQLEKSMVANSWRFLEGYGVSVPIDKLLTKPFNWDGIELGVEKRRKKRKVKRRENIEIVEACIKSHFPNELPKKITREDIDKIQCLIDEKLAYRGWQHHHCSVLLWRYMSRLRSRGIQVVLPPRKILLPPEKSPFEASFPSNYALANQVRKNFVNYLEERGNLGMTPTLVEHISEVIVSAALFGGLVRVEHLEMLPQTLGNNAYCIGKHHMAIDFETDEINLYRWLPCGLSLSLISRVDPKKLSKLSKPSVKASVKRLLAEISNFPKPKDPYRFLSEVSSAYWQYHLPGFLFSVCAGRSSYTPLPLSAVARIIRKEPLSAVEIKDKTKAQCDSALFEFKEPEVSLGAGKEALKLISNAVNKARKDIPLGDGDKDEKEPQLPVANEYPDSRRKKNLRRRLIKIAKEQTLSPVALAVVAWGIHLCKYGTANMEVLAFNTVTKYLGLAKNALLESASEHDFFNLDSEHYQEIYGHCIENYESEDNGETMAGRLREFHRFLEEFMGVEYVDWSELFDFSNDSGFEKANANLLTPNEYIDALNILAGLSTIDLRRRRLYSAIMILAYRFGLRIGEIFRLRLIDIINQDNIPELIIDVSNNLYGSTKSSAGVRQVPLLETLTANEIKILEKVFSHASLRAEKDKQAAIFSTREEGRLLIDRTEAVDCIHHVLRHVTGDPTFRQHHLRRSFECRITTHVFQCVKPASTEISLATLLTFENDASCDVCKKLYGYSEIVGESLRPLSVIIGHASVKTTISYYIHVIEYYAMSIIRSHQLPEASDHATAYATEHKPGAIRRQRSRKGIDKKDFSGSVLSNPVKLDWIPDIPVSTEPLKMKDFVYLKVRADHIGMDELERILLLKSVRYSATTSQIASHFIMPESEVELILEKVSSIESEYRYKHYQLNPKTSLGWLRKGSNVFRGPTLTLEKDTLRVRDSLKNIEYTVNEKLRSNEVKFVGGLRVWARCYTNQIPSLVFPHAEDCQRYLELLDIIGVERSRLLAYIPAEMDEDSRQDFTSEIKKLGFADKQIITRRLKVSVNEGSKETTIGPVAVALKSGEHLLSYQKTLDRLCFVLCVWFLWKKTESDLSIF